MYLLIFLNLGLAQLKPGRNWIQSIESQNPNQEELGHWYFIQTSEKK